MILGLIQSAGNCQTESRFNSIFQKVIDAADRGARVIALPELFLNPYFCQTKNPRHFELACSRKTANISKLQKLSEEMSLVLVVPFFEISDSKKYYNSCAVFESGRYLGMYRKMHLPDDPGFHEKYYFTEGDLGYKVFDTEFGKIGILLCFDQWFPEAARINALLECDIIIIPTAIGWDKRELEDLTSENQENLKKDQLSAWLTVQQGHSIANGCYLAAVNRVGTEDNLIFWGNSFVAGPFGKILKQLGDSEEEPLIFACDFSENKKVRETWTFLRDRRPDSYHDLSRIPHPQS